MPQGTAVFNAQIVSVTEGISLGCVLRIKGQRQNILLPYCHGAFSSKGVWSNN